jgi:hypothetical protein
MVEMIKTKLKEVERFEHLLRRFGNCFEIRASDFEFQLIAIVTDVLPSRPCQHADA